MAHANPSSPLRAITVRLSSTPAKQLPHIAAFLANDIGRCAAELSIPSSQSKNGSESAVLVHKLKTQIASLLQGKHVEERWSATVLVKATVEAGGWEVLQSSGTWVRGMLAILGRPDPDATKQLCMLTLTRIFSLAQGQQNLTREIVTPSLPAFFSHGLQAVTRKAARDDAKQVDSQSPLLETVLQAFAHVIPHHPSACRPFVGQIKTLLAPLLAPTPSNLQPKSASSFKGLPVPQSSTILARKLHTLLPTCAPKNTASEEHGKSVKALITHLRRTADHVFRAVVEEPRPQTSTVDARAYDQVVADKWDDEFGLPGWRGVYAGAERLAGLMNLLQAYISTTGSMPYNLPVGSIWRCIERLLGVVGPVSPIYRAQIGQLAQNPEIDRDEREGLWTALPLVHVAALETIAVLTARLDLASGSIHAVAVDQLVWSFKACGDERRVRNSIYATLAQMLDRFGPSTSQATVKSMAPLIRTCCEDVLLAPTERSLSVPFTNGANKLSAKASTDNADSYLKSSTKPDPTQDDCLEVREAALQLLPLFLSKLPSQFISSSLRTQIDRTAILVNHKDTMLASVLNPPHQRSKGKGVNSIMPFIARAHPDATEVETLIRPRMPLIPSRKLGDDAPEPDDDQDDPRTTHDPMIIDQDEGAQHLDGNTNDPHDPFQALLDQETSENPGPDTDSQRIDMREVETAPSSYPAKRPRTSSPDGDLPPAEPPSKRINLDPLAPHLSSLPPVTATEDKALLDAGSLSAPAGNTSKPPPAPGLGVEISPAADELNETIESEDPSRLDKGKGRAAFEGGEGESEGGRREGGGGEGGRDREEREGSWIGSETPEINTELNPAFFASSEEEEEGGEEEDDEEG